MKKTIAFVSALAVVFCCSFPVFADSTPVADTFGNDYYLINNNLNVYAHLNLTAFRPYPSGESGNLVTAQFDTLGELILFNNSDTDFIFDGDNTNHVYMTISVSSNANGNIPWSIINFEYIGGQLNVSQFYQNILIFENYHPYSDGDLSNIIIPAHSQVLCYFKLTYQANMASLNGLITPKFNTSSVFLTSGFNYSGHYENINKNYQSFIPDIYDAIVDSYNRLGVIDQHLLDILNAYNSNVQGAENVTDQADTQSNTIDNQHQTESNYFSGSQSAIQDTGIQNFQFNSQEISGLNGLKDDFTAVWVSCGTLSRVWITSLTIGLALSIIRHRRMFEK